MSRLLIVAATAALVLFPAAARAEMDPDGRCGTPEDCCSNGDDDDFDGLVDCADPECSGVGGCGGGGSETDCANGADDDGDGQADCTDPDCAASPDCAPPAEGPCDDGEDGDEDGLVDCEDPDCADDEACLTETICDDGEDDDGDGAADCEDEDCADDEACDTESDCANGEDDDGDGLVDCADGPDCSDDEACQEQECSDGTDDDGDGLVDCADVDCHGRECCGALERCDDLVDNDFDGLIDCEDVDQCLDADPCAEPGEVCDNEEDDDEDGLADCEDPQCVRFAGCPPPPPSGATPPPTLDASVAEIACFWPPDHRFHCIPFADIPFTSADGCGALSLIVVGCTSSQPDDGTGDGRFVDDCRIESDRVCVRAERDGGDDEDRRYVLTAVLVDALGRASDPVPVATVRVPRSGAGSRGCFARPRFEAPDRPVPPRR